MQLDRIAVLSFDCYGTLVDWERGILDALSPWRARTGLAVDDEALLAAFAEEEAAQERETPSLRYDLLLARVGARLGRRFGAPMREDEQRAFGASVGDWPPFPDSAEALARLARAVPLVVLSNVDEASIRRSAARLGDPFAALLTAEAIGSYKPDLRNFAYLLGFVRGRGWPREGLAHVAQSLFHDHVPAAAVGIPSIWIDRRAGRPGGATPPPARPVAPALRFPDLASFARAFEAARRGRAARGDTDLGA
ncbi:MAG: HAD-IA family hydrolase [Geminicoccaceae bacterium]|nr:HAD-IA family hydrolase [Geminicoccaceae bacterium]MDW8444035.1 HAD-IA family hydrolase [Acetobacteraceae bacterium]MCS7268182.1 HAD-IA family hydrolase [Geminicoccaceae bacterium]MCX7630703.1 HAD-IA family hydrolase [Geminicoccaceae bacterium]MDW8125948.1 HAD-IA family hydrolase [Geminicoccaceae bacterium]